jgi:hypothetical protein
MNSGAPDFSPAEFIFTFAGTRDAIEGEKKLIAGGIHPAVLPLPDSLGPDCGICLRVSPAELERARAALGTTFRGLYALCPAAGPSGKKEFRTWNP